MNLQVGEILEGKVTGVTKFGAFVQLPGGQSGLVHISEIANAFVNDVNDYLHVGDNVKVKVIAVTEAGKINLSIKQTVPPPARAPHPRPAPGGQASRPAGAPRPAPRPAFSAEGELIGPSGDASFEDKLKHFIQESEGRISDSKIYNDRKNGGRRRK